MNDLPTLRAATRAALRSLRDFTAVPPSKLYDFDAAWAVKDTDPSKLDAYNLAETAYWKAARNLWNKLADAAEAEFSAMCKAGVKAPLAFCDRREKTKRDGSGSGVYQYRDGDGKVLRESRREYRWTSKCAVLDLETGELSRNVGGYGFSSSKMQMEKTLRPYQTYRRLDEVRGDQPARPVWNSRPKVLEVVDAGAAAGGAA